MNAKHFNFLPIALAIGLAMATCPRTIYAQTADSTSTPPPVPSAELPPGSEVLTRGPVHEAFAKPVATDPQAPLVVTKQPPSPLQEMPPAEKPAGANIVWVPGYWAWDDDRADFIWVSGCWRNAPPETYWMPGYWLQIDTGWEWIAGFWKPMTAQPQQEIEYLPAPPPAFEVEAIGTAPFPDQIWVPGCWYWQSGRYIQRHGYWSTCEVGWVWTPSHYVWSPRGYIFCSGHWDYDMDNRGVLFSPVYFPEPARVQIGFVFSPGICVDLEILQLNLFVSQRYNHYCFGDYYDAGYERRGIYPWFRCQTIHTWYDPLFVYNRWHNERTDPNWARHQAQQFKQLQSNQDLRPAHTYTELQNQWAHQPAAKRSERPLAENVKTYAASQSTPVKFERISTAERQQITAKSTEVGDFRKQRNGWESPAHQTTTAPANNRPASRPETKPAPAPVPRQPVVAPAQSAPAVRITQPEREVVPNPPISSRPSGSRYIEKTSPSAPPLESGRQAPVVNPKSSSNPGNSPGNSQGNSQGNNPQRKDWPK